MGGTHRAETRVVRQAHHEGLGAVRGVRDFYLTPSSFLPGLDQGIHSVWRHRMDPRVKPEGEGGDVTSEGGET